MRELREVRGEEGHGARRAPREHAREAVLEVRDQRAAQARVGRRLRGTLRAPAACMARLHQELSIANQI